MIVEPVGPGDEVPPCATVGANVMPTWIAEQPVIFVYPDGRRVVGRIAVGLPVRIGAAEARCSIWLEGFYQSPTAISGSDTLQALMLAVRFAGMLLHDFLLKGGRILDPDARSDVPLEAVFGPLLQEPRTVEKPLPARRGIRRPPAQGARRRSPRRAARKK